MSCRSSNSKIKKEWKELTKVLLFSFAEYTDINKRIIDEIVKFGNDINANKRALLDLLRAYQLERRECCAALAGKIDTIIDIFTDFPCICPPATTTTTEELSTTTTEESPVTTATEEPDPDECNTPTHVNQKGASYPYVVTKYLGTDLGQVTLTFDSFDIPDRFVVEWGGSNVIDTGYHGLAIFQPYLNAAVAAYGDTAGAINTAQTGTATFIKDTAEEYAIVKVYAPLGNTRFELTLSCPEPYETTTTTTENCWNWILTDIADDGAWTYFDVEYCDGTSEVISLRNGDSRVVCLSNAISFDPLRGTAVNTETACTTTTTEEPVTTTTEEPTTTTTEFDCSGFVVEVLDPIPVTTTTTTGEPVTTTTEEPGTTTTTEEPTTTTTPEPCIFPPDYTIDAVLNMTVTSPPLGVFAGSFVLACNALYGFNNLGYTIDPGYHAVSKRWNFNDYWRVGDFVYDTDECTLVPSGYYIVQVPGQVHRIIYILNGEIISYPECPEDTTTTTTEEPCSVNLCDYGLLYNWFAVDTGKLAPTNWNVPTRANWETLVTWLTDEGYGYGGTGDDVAKSAAYDCGWTVGGVAGDVGYDQASNNSSGFSGLPAGRRSFTDGGFANKGDYCNFFASTEYDGDEAYGRTMLYYSNLFSESTPEKRYGHSIRCMMSNSVYESIYGVWQAGDTITDYDGNVYDVIKLGGQIWTVQNLKVVHYNDGESIPNITDNAEWAALNTGACCAYNNDWDTYGCVDEPTTTTTTEEPTTTTTEGVFCECLFDTIDIVPEGVQNTIAKTYGTYSDHTQEQYNAQVFSLSGPATIKKIMVNVIRTVGSPEMDVTCALYNTKCYGGDFFPGETLVANSSNTIHLEGTESRWLCFEFDEHLDQYSGVINPACNGETNRPWSFALILSNFTAPQGLNDGSNYYVFATADDGYAGGTFCYKISPLDIDPWGEPLPEYDLASVICLEYDQDTTTTTTEEETTTTTTTTELPAPEVYPGGSVYNAHIGSGCSIEEYPYTTYNPFPMYIGNQCFSPSKLWSDIDYIEIMAVTPVSGIVMKYNGIIVAPGLKLYPIGEYTWEYLLEEVRSELDYDNIYEEWSIRIKLFGYQITDSTIYDIYFDQRYCITTTTTTTEP